MRTVEQIVEQVRAAAGADFAFVLTRKGRLVTHRAPRDMPEEGRQRLARAARPLVGTDRIIEVTLPREELVPYGGAAPLDVFIGVVAEQAIVCVAMASWADKMRVVPAIEPGMRAIAPLLRRGLPSVRRAGSADPVKGSPYVRERASIPPESGPMGLASAPVIELRPSLIPEIPTLPSLPEIALGEAQLGRESLIAIGRDAARGGTAPDIIVSEASLGRESMVAIRRDGAAGGSMPEITLGAAPLGRESMIAIERASDPGIDGAFDGESKKRPSSSPEAIRVELVSMPDPDVRESGRVTLPWVEVAEDTKRAADAARLGRKLAPPKVTIKLEDADASDAASRLSAKR